MEDKEIIEKIKKCKTVEELKTFGNEIDYSLTDEEAKEFFEKLSKCGELSDDELTNVNGGGCTKWRNGRAYSGNPEYWLIVTVGNTCPGWERSRTIGHDVRRVCPNCRWYNSDAIPAASICHIRTYYNDKYNPYIPKK